MNFWKWIKVASAIAFALVCGAAYLLGSSDQPTSSRAPSTSSNPSKYNF